MSTLHHTGDDIPTDVRSDCEVQWGSAEELIGVLCKLLRPGGPPTDFAGDVELAQALDVVLNPIVRHIADLQKAVYGDESRSVRALKKRCDALQESYDELLGLFYIIEKDSKNLIECIKKADISLPADLGCDFDGNPVGLN
jgi:hypothetical protein